MLAQSWRLLGKYLNFDDSNDFSTFLHIESCVKRELCTKCEVFAVFFCDFFQNGYLNAGNFLKRCFAHLARFRGYRSFKSREYKSSQRFARSKTGKPRNARDFKTSANNLKNLCRPIASSLVLSKAIKSCSKCIQFFRLLKVEVSKTFSRVNPQCKTISPVIILKNAAKKTLKQWRTY